MIHTEIEYLNNKIQKINFKVVPLCIIYVCQSLDTSSVGWTVQCAYKCCNEIVSTPNMHITYTSIIIY